MANNQISNWYTGQVVTQGEMTDPTRDVYDRINALCQNPAPCILYLDGVISQTGSDVTIPDGAFRFAYTPLVYLQFQTSIIGNATTDTVTVSGDGYVVARYTITPNTSGSTNYDISVAYLFTGSITISDCIICEITAGTISGYGSFLVNKAASSAEAIARTATNVAITPKNINDLFPHITDEATTPYNVSIDTTGNAKLRTTSTDDPTIISDIYTAPITVSGDVYTKTQIYNYINSNINAGFDFTPAINGAGLGIDGGITWKHGTDAVTFISSYDDTTDIFTSYYTAWTNYFESSDRFFRIEAYKNKFTSNLPYTACLLKNAANECGITFYEGQTPQLVNTFPPFALGAADIVSNKEFSTIDRGFSLPVNSSIIPQSHDNTYIFKRHMVVDISGLTELDVEWTENPSHELISIPTIHCEYENNPINHHLANLTNVGGKIVFNTTVPAGTKVHITIHGVLPNV